MATTQSSTITESAHALFEACETGEGWEGCSAYCHPNATFSAQAEPLADVRTLKDYAEWMKGLLNFIPDGRYELKSFATDQERSNSAPTPSSPGRTAARAGRCPQRAGARARTTCTRCSSRTERSVI